jgi:hypothetical protein
MVTKTSVSVRGTTLQRLRSAAGYLTAKESRTVTLDEVISRMLDRVEVSNPETDDSQESIPDT